MRARVLRTLHGTPRAGATMKRRWAIALSLIVAYAMACSSRAGFEGPAGGNFASSDASADTCGDPICSVDMKSVVTCDGALVQRCGPGEGCAFGSCVAACKAAAEAKSSLGCEFVLVPPDMGTSELRGINGSCYAAFVANAWNVPLDLGLEYDGAPLDLKDSIYVADGARLTPHRGPLAPGQGVVVFLSQARFPPGGGGRFTPCPDGVTPAMLHDPIGHGTTRTRSFRLSASMPVSAYAIFPFGGAKSFAPAATLLLPIASLGTNYVVVTPWQRLVTSNGSYEPTVQIVAVADDTEVRLRPTTAISAREDVAGAARGIAQAWTLRKGEVLQIGEIEELVGSPLEASKPVAVFGGHNCMFVPSEIGACDAAQQQIPPLLAWGREYVVARHRARWKGEAGPVRIVAAFDGTELTYEPARPEGAKQHLAATEVTTFSSSSPFVVRSQDAAHPIYVASYMTGGGSPGATGEGDPDFVNVIATEQYIQDYTFFTDASYANTSIVVVRKRTPAGFADVELDCAGKLMGFRPVDSEGEYEVATLDLTRDFAAQRFEAKSCGYGSRHAKSESPFALTVWGSDQYASYGYPAGSAIRTVGTRVPEVR